MFKGSTFLAVIPARGASKRLPRKNLLDLNGKPLITYTIEAGLKSRYVDEVIVSSDDHEILQISEKLGVKTLVRPDNLATDIATTFDTIEHVINNVKKYDYIVLLQPTSPLRTQSHIDEAIYFLYTHNADAVISVCEMDHSPLWSNTLPMDRSMIGFLKHEVLNKRSQDLDIFYRLNGAIYICKRERFLEERSFLIRDNIFAYVMDRKYSIDIDEKIDFDIAEVFMKNMEFME